MRRRANYITNKNVIDRKDEATGREVDPEESGLKKKIVNTNNRRQLATF